MPALVKRRPTATPKKQNPMPKSNVGIKKSKRRSGPSIGLSASLGAPVSISTRMNFIEPSISYTSAGVTVRHKELVVSGLAGSVAYTTQYAIPINPGLASTFPWLSNLAQNYETYRCKTLCLHYVPFCSTSTSGEVYLAPIYDATRPAPVAETDMANLADNVSNTCWTRIECPMNPRALMSLGPSRFIRSGNVLGDLKTYDLGSMVVATVNMAGTTTVGKIWVEYEFVLENPRSAINHSYIAQETSHYVQSASQPLVTSTLQNAFKNTDQKHNSAGYFINALSITPSATGLFTIPAGGVYRVHAQIAIYCTAGSGAAARFTVALFLNGAASIYSGGLTVTSYQEMSFNVDDAIIIPLDTIVSVDPNTTLAVAVTPTFSTGSYIINSNSAITISSA